MTKFLNRRQFIAASVTVLATGCSRRGRQSTRYSTTGLPAQVPTNSYLYTIQKGDTLSSISRRSGLSIRDIMQANDLHSNVLRIGQHLALPNVKTLGVDPLAQATIHKADPAETWVGTPYKVVPRSQWTTNKLRKNRKAMGQINRITIHHTSEHGNMMTWSDKKIVQSIENYHRNERKWACIGYHYLIGRDGTIYEGRPARYQGAHTRNANSKNLGISVIGDFNKKLPSHRQLAALRSFLNDKRQFYGVSTRRVYGHRDLSPSRCPGDKLYAWVQSYKQA